MINKDKSGKFRVRYDFGHNKYYSFLKKEKRKIQAELETLKSSESAKKEDLQALHNKLSRIENDINLLEKKYGKPVNTPTRRSFNCRNRWQAELIEKIFIDAHNLEVRGEQLPPYLIKELKTLKEAPHRLDYLEELSYKFASFSGFNPSVIPNLDYDLFLKQADVNMDWIESFQITQKEVIKQALLSCFDRETIPLKGKTYIYTGSFVSYTVCEEFVDCLIKVVDNLKVDGIIVNGPWVKYIFLHKTSKNQKILTSVKKLASKIKIYAIRSNRESAELIPKLKDIGINFVSKIEDENNLFLNHQFSKTSQKDQLHRFRDYFVDKNLFVSTSYVALEPQLRNDNIRYIIGCGSSSFNTPGSRIWSTAYDTARLNSEKFDNLGGHLLRFDLEGNVYPSNFYYNDKVKAIFLNGLMYPLKGEVTSADLHILINDVHSDSIDKKAFNGLLWFIQKNADRIKSININGDFFDNALLCHHNENKIDYQIKNKLRAKSFLHEIAQARGFLEDIISRLGKNKDNVKLRFKYGNHELNSIKRLLNKPTVHFLDNLLDFDKLLGLSEMGFEIIEGNKIFHVGSIPVFHGHELTRVQASKILGRSSVSGHLHRGKIDNYGTMVPTLQDQEKVDYLRYHKTDWVTGWGVIMEFQGITEKPELVLINKNKFFDFEKIVKINNPYKEREIKEIKITYKLD